MLPFTHPPPLSLSKRKYQHNYTYSKLSLSHTFSLTHTYTLILKVPKEAVEEMIKEVDIDNNGGIDFDEFVFIMTDGAGIPVSESEMMDQETQLKKSKSKDTVDEEAQQHARAMYLSSHIRKAWKGEARNK
jgi:hypothetical protein